MCEYGDEPQHAEGWYQTNGKACYLTCTYDTYLLSGEAVEELYKMYWVFHIGVSVISAKSKYIAMIGSSVFKYLFSSSVPMNLNLFL